MKYKLYGENKLSIENALINRGVRTEDIEHYLNTTDNDINVPELLSTEKLQKAYTFTMDCVENDRTAVCIVDCDADGYTSSALLANYLYAINPEWTKEKLHFCIHEGKQHGLNDCMNVILQQNNVSIVFAPDCGSNDFEEQEVLMEHGIVPIILDHHEYDTEQKTKAIIINNQIGEYSNKALSGVGVTWQFCRYIDKQMNTTYAEKFYDLVALGSVSDMMDMTSIETKHIIHKGFEDKRIHNPFICGIFEKNKFSIGSKLTPHGAAFFITPYINAVVRSGTMEEKSLLFNSMLTYKAFDEVDSTKRGHKEGEKETILAQALRVVANVKNRQTKAQDIGVEKLEKYIKEQNLLSNKVLLFLLEEGEIDSGLAGLIANKMMAKYQRPCCILTKIGEEYKGSARGCDLAGIKNFKDICESTHVVEWAIGHQGAFGLCIAQNKVNDFIEKTNLLLADMSNEPIYYVDAICQDANINGQEVISISGYSDLWGTGMPEPLIAIEDLRVNSNMVNVYVKKNNTLKISLPNKISIMLFDAPQDLCDSLKENELTKLDIIGTCQINSWNGYEYPQIFVKDYEIIS